MPAKNNKANALANLGNFDNAIALYDQILEKNPDYLTARKNLDTVLLLNADVTDSDHASTDSNIENIAYAESSESEKIIPNNQKKQEPTDFINELSLVFSTLGSLFGFMN
ncbi:tetratricopeptide repeat protein [Candidatus Nitrosopumilus salaria BD31]|uniref:Tetratricopeptide repeat protein n=1 Tax=Candidatus Nitrosopumilus salarius BD31 TaxID=859350 RepID=I3D425_9ARCH|nr:tetratricopeptide repeat protein [Candidatus Nitrosopumilus salaria]EIJ66468.1 tetratricopeptide repeat protein [Candidatus Nitrosopumilus salaria BD31]